MDCFDLYVEMCAEGIIMNESLRNKIIATDIETLRQCWIGVTILADRRPHLKNRAGWMAKMMWTETALVIGQKESNRKKAEERRLKQISVDRQTEERRQMKLEVEADRKWDFWLTCPNRISLVRDHVRKQDPFFQDYFTAHFMTPESEINRMTKRQVMNWLWDLLPVHEDIRNNDFAGINR